MGTSGRVKCFMKRRNAKFQRYCPVAQSVEHAAVNRAVVGSSPTGAASGKVWKGPPAEHAQPKKDGNKNDMRDCGSPHEVLAM